VNPLTTAYIGRFAPSPTGPLHLGSLLTALASYFDAKSRGGLWKVRIEDLDPPREKPGASAYILQSLKNYGLSWDGDVVYQSHRHAIYQQYVEQCLDEGFAYYCKCSRQEIQTAQSLEGEYTDACMHHPLKPTHQTPCAIRIKPPKHTITFVDQCQGTCEYLSTNIDHFAIKRKDGLFAYHLACVVDDYLQGVTHIVRGIDLINSTPHQIYLQHQLGFVSPNYLHLPIVANKDGQKLSKQTYATDINQLPINPTITQLLASLGIPAPQSIQHDTASLLQWGIDHWCCDAIPNKQIIADSDLKHPTN
jgi:glutamyl-Q tRNA(Asp) synthetase